MNKLILPVLIILSCLFSLISYAAFSYDIMGEDSLSINAYFKREATPDEPEAVVEEEVEEAVLPWVRFESGPNSAMAVLITNPNCSWMALTRGLKTIGVPFVITNNFKTAFEHKVVMIYPELNTNTADISVFYDIRDFVRNGGVLIGTNVEGLGLEDVFGYSKTGFAENVNAIQLNKTSFQFETFDSKKDQNIDIKSIMLYMKTVKYLNPLNFPIATFDNGSAALLENSFGKGKAYAIGFDIGSLLSRGLNGKHLEDNPSCSGQYKPNLDVFLRLIREFYREGGGITFGTSPHGMHLTVILTHNIDQNNSVSNSLEFAKFEKQLNLSSTFFMQTRYDKIRNNEEVLFTDENLSTLKEIKAMNFEIASNGVTSSKSFFDFLPGKSDESFNSYHPILNENEQVIMGSVSGELKVSKQLLDSALQSNVVSFRPGYLTYPKTLPQALVATNYKFSSSITANDVLTHLPFQLTLNREDTMDIPAFEFPVTIDDNGKDPLNLQQAITIAKQISKEDGIMVLSIRPDNLDKLEFEKKFATALIDKAVFKSLGEYGSWWETRNEVRIEVKGNKIILDSPRLIEGLTLQMPDGTNKILPFFKDHLEIDYPSPALSNK